MVESKIHYPDNYRKAEGIPYRQIVSADSQVHRSSVTFQYRISYRLRRQHYNPPIWTQVHYHTFDISILLESVRSANDMYGVDIVEWESRLQQWAESIPATVNDLPGYELGTTEDMCIYISKIPLDDHIKIIQVSVSETPQRVTILNL